MRALYWKWKVWGRGGDVEVKGTGKQSVVAEEAFVKARGGRGRVED